MAQIIAARSEPVGPGAAPSLRFCTIVHGIGVNVAVGVLLGVNVGVSVLLGVKVSVGVIGVLLGVKVSVGGIGVFAAVGTLVGAGGGAFVADGSRVELVVGLADDTKTTPIFVAVGVSVAVSVGSGVNWIVPVGVSVNVWLGVGLIAEGAPGA